MKPAAHSSVTSGVSAPIACTYRFGDYTVHPFADLVITLCIRLPDCMYECNCETALATHAEYLFKHL